MKTCDLFKKKTVLSFEVFPPKRTDAVDTVYTTVAALKELSPDFISVTYGAGGGRGRRTRDLRGNARHCVGDQT